MLQSFLSAVPVTLPGQGYEIGLDFLGQFAKVIIEGIGIIGLGIIVFTLVLKAITLPFDIYQRVKMRKQNLIMRQMQPELEKLQKQYANDKNTYNLKMNELYKKNGYSMFSACLPMIISLVILIVAFQGFNAYSRYANLAMYENMSVAYNAAILEHGVDGIDYNLKQEADEYTVVFQEGVLEQGNDEIIYTMYLETNDQKYMRVESADASHYVYYIYSLDAGGNREYKIDSDKLYAAADETFRAEVDAVGPAVDADETVTAENKETEKASRIAVLCGEYVEKIGATAAAEWYRGGNDAHFLWVKNIWYSDVSYQHPIQNYDAFRGQLNTQVTLPDGTRAELSSVLNAEQYRALTSQLTEEQSQPNGYFILIILSIGLMLLSQFVSMRSQKESSQFQSVDGSGAKSQKVMMVILPIIYGVFAFFYSAAFSIYMVMSSLISLIVTLLSNLIIGRIFKKKEEAALVEKYSRTLPWQKQQQNGKDKNDKKKK